MSNNTLQMAVVLSMMSSSALCVWCIMTQNPLNSLFNLGGDAAKSAGDLAADTGNDVADAFRAATGQKTSGNTIKQLTSGDRDSECQAKCGGNCPNNGGWLRGTPQAQEYQRAWCKGDDQTLARLWPDLVRGTPAEGQPVPDSSAIFGSPCCQ